MRGVWPRAWLILLAFGLLLLIINWVWGSANTLPYVEATVLVLTLSAVARYAFDAYRLAEASEEHFRYLSTPVLSVWVQPQLYQPRLANAPDPRTTLFIKNDSRYNVEVRVRIVLQYGGHKAIHPDRYYSGQTIWNIGPGDLSNGNFSILPFFADAGDSPESMELKLNQQSPQLKIFIFSQYRVFDRGEKEFTRNMARTNVLKYKELRHDVIMLDPNVVPLPYTWVYEFDSPPEEIARIAFEDGW